MFFLTKLSRLILNSLYRHGRPPVFNPPMWDSKVARITDLCLLAQHSIFYFDFFSNIIFTRILIQTYLALVLHSNTESLQSFYMCQLCPSPLFRKKKVASCWILLTFVLELEEANYLETSEAHHDSAFFFKKNYQEIIKTSNSEHVSCGGVMMCELFIFRL